MSKWMDATVFAAVFHLQSKHHVAMRPPSFFEYDELNQLNLTRDRERWLANNNSTSLLSSRNNKNNNIVGASTSSSPLKSIIHHSDVAKHDDTVMIATENGHVPLECNTTRPFNDNNNVIQNNSELSALTTSKVMSSIRRRRYRKCDYSYFFLSKSTLCSHSILF